MEAIASGGIRVVNDEVVGALGIDQGTILRVAAPCSVPALADIPLGELDPAPGRHRRALGVALLGSARLDGKRELELVKRVPIFFGRRADGRLQRVEEFLLLLPIEFEILAG